MFLKRDSIFGVKVALVLRLKRMQKLATYYKVKPRKRGGNQNKLVRTGHQRLAAGRRYLHNFQKLVEGLKYEKKTEGLRGDVR